MPRPKVLALVLSADHVYRLDYGEVLAETHVPRGATVAPGGRLGQDGAREPAA